jgi:hypothetical protein
MISRMIIAILKIMPRNEMHREMLDGVVIHDTGDILLRNR